MATQASEPHGLLAIAELLAARTGIAFAPHSSDGLVRAARRVMARHELGSFEQLAARLSGDSACFASLVDEVTVGETYFFRNPEHFALLRSSVLPALLAARPPEHTLQVWSAGCATGEEPYSLAMLLDGEGLLARSRIYASDIAGAALVKARAARYREWSRRGLDPLIEQRWLRLDHNEAQVCDHIRRSVTFLQLNLAEASYPALHDGLFALDLIFCRNVLIYFDPATIEAVERRLFAALAPGGFLLLGPSDPMLGRHAPFEVQITDSGLCYRRPAGVVSRSVRPPPPAFATDPAAPAPAASRPPPAPGVAPRDVLAEPPSPAPAEQIRAAWRAHGPEVGLRECERRLERDALSAELHHLHALLLLDLGRENEALVAARRTLYLDAKLAIAQFTLGSILERAGRPVAARRPYRNALDAAASLPSDQLVPLAEGVAAGALAAAARSALARLGEG